MKSWDLIPLEERMDMPLVLSAKERASTLARTARTWKAYLSVFSALSKKAMLRTTLGKRKRKRAATEQEEESEEEEQTMRRRRRVRRRTGHEEESEEE